MSLETLIREPKIIVIGDEKLEITQIRTKHIPAVMRTAFPIFGMLAALEKEKESKKEKDSKKDKDAEKDKDPEVDILTLITEHSESVIDLVAIGTGKSVEWVGELEIDAMIEVTSAVIEVNALFFVNVVLPMLAKKMVAVKSMGALAAGPSPSSV